MEKRLLLVLLLVAGIAFPFTHYQDRFSRPWNSEPDWPGNTGVVTYTYSPPLAPGWNVELLQDSMNSLNAYSLNESFDGNGNVAAAKRNFTVTRAIHDELALFVRDGLMPYFVNPEVYEAVLGQPRLANCTCEFSALTGLDCSSASNCLGAEIRYTLGVRLVSDEYSTAWKNTMDNALGALENGASELNSGLSELEANYSIINASGACDAQVEGYENCANASLVLAAAEEGGAGRLAKFQTIRAALDFDYYEVRKPVPMLEFAPVMVEFYGEDGAIARTDSASSALNTHFASVLKRTRERGTAAGTEIDAASAMNRTAHGDGLEMMNAGPATAGAGMKTVAGRASEAEGMLALALESRKAANRTYISAEGAYVKSALSNYTDAEALALQSQRGFGEAEKDAEEVVAEYSNDSLDWASKVTGKFSAGVWPEEARALYDEAVLEMDAGAKTKRPGERFVHYQKAISLAKDAYGIAPLAAENINISQLASCTEAEDLLNRAEKDGVDVGYEKLEYSILANRTTNASYRLEKCQDIAGRIVDEAKYAYADLENARVRLFYLLGRCPANDCEDLKYEISRAEAGLVKSGQITYPKAIGSLAGLRRMYSERANEAEDSIRSDIAAFLFVTSDLFVADSELDTPTEAQLRVAAANQVDYPGSNLKFDAGSALEFAPGDATRGAGNLLGASYSDGKMHIWMRNINASGSEIFVFERNTTVLRTVKTTSRAVGLDDGSADVVEQRDVSCDAELPRFYVPMEWKTLSVDGIPVELGRFGWGRADLNIDEGRHAFEAAYSVPDAYSREVVSSNSSTAGTRTYFKYTVGLVPAISMEYLTTYAAVPQDALVKEKKVITLTGEKVESYETDGSFRVTVSKLNAGRATRFQVSYVIDNTTEFIGHEIDNISGLDLSNITWGLVGEARNALLRNDSAGALEKLQQAREQIALEKKNIEKAAREFDEYSKLADGELTELDGVLAVHVEDEFADKLTARRDFLRELLSTARGQGVEQGAATLKKYDAKWLPAELKAFRKNASTEINAMNTALLDSGTADGRAIGGIADARVLYRKFETSGTLKDAYALLVGIDGCRDDIAVLLAETEARNSAMRTDAAGLLDSLGIISKKYSIEYDDAKGSRFEPLFALAPADAQANAKALEKALSTGDAKTLANAYNRSAETFYLVNKTLSYLEASAGRNAAETRGVFNASRGKLSEKDVKKIEALLKTMDGQLDAGNWAAALKSADAVMEATAAAENTGNYDIVVLLSAAFVVAVAAVYYFKGRGNGGLILAFGRKKQKEYRKLEKAV